MSGIRKAGESCRLWHRPGGSGQAGQTDHTANRMNINADQKHLQALKYICASRSDS